MKKIPRVQIECSDQEKSAFCKYLDLIIGTQSLFYFIKYELITSLFGGIPGALGLLLRKITYPWILGSVGKNVIFGKNLTLRHPLKIHISDGCIIDDYVMLDAKGDGNQGISLGHNVFVGRFSVLSSKNGDITLGDDCNLGFYCEIFSSSSVTLGPKCLLAAYTYIIGGGHDCSDPEIPVTDQPDISHGIQIGENVWFGSGSKILDGVTIGSHVIIGAQAVVCKDLSNGSVAVGVPAKVIRYRDCIS